MTTETVKRIEVILKDHGLSRKAKVAKLRQLEADAMAKERASTEGMAPPDAEEGEDIKAIEQALKELGEGAAETGPASL